MHSVPEQDSGFVTTFIAAVTGVAAAVFILTLVNATLYAPDTSTVDTATSTTPGPPAIAQTMSLPVRLQIPSLSIDTRVQYVGTNAKGEMGIPNNFRDVAWYRQGSVPGQLGSAVMSGHVDNALARAGVFKYLGDMKIGDDVYVVTKDGSKLHFVVSGIETYPYNAGPLERIFAASDVARLNLITCAGTWVRGKRTYDERLVVYTTYVDA